MIASQIQDLPSKALVQIFLHISSERSQIEQGSAYDWIPAITHVCRQWRTLGIATPELWIIISLDCSLELIETMLRRSNPFPIMVIQPSRKPSSDLLYNNRIAKILEQFSRFRFWSRLLVMT